MNKKYNTKSGVQPLYSDMTGSQTCSILPWLSTVPFIYDLMEKHYDKLTAAILRQQKPQVIPKAAINSSEQEKAPPLLGVHSWAISWTGGYVLVIDTFGEGYISNMPAWVGKKKLPALPS